MGKANFANKAVLTGALALGCASQQPTCPQPHTSSQVQASESYQAKPEYVTPQPSRPADKLYHSVENVSCSDSPDNKIPVKKTTTIWIAQLGDSFGYEIPVKVPHGVDGARITKIYEGEGVELSNINQDLPGPQHDSEETHRFGEEIFFTAGEACENVILTFQGKSATQVKIRIEQTDPIPSKQNAN